MGKTPMMAQRQGSLKLLMATARYFPYTGGTESHVYEVGRRLAQAGVRVTVLTTDGGGTLARAEECNGVQIRRVRSSPAQGDYYFSPDIYRTIVAGDWDIVHCQGVHTLVAPFAMLAAWRAKIPYVVTFHTGGHSSGWRNALRGMQWRMLRPLLSRAERLIAVSRFEADLFQKKLGLPKEQFVIIPNGSELPIPTSQNPRSSADTLIVSVGRLERYKGHQRIITALPRILEHCPDVRVVILGAGPYERELRRIAENSLVADRVEIRAIPAVRRKEMAAMLMQAALVVLFSEYEAHPVSVMEALALGRPVLVTDAAGLGELAQRGLVRAIPLDSQPDEVASAVLEQLRHPMVPEPIHLPTWEDCTASLLSVYRSIPERKLCAS
jgi:glycosyltransferase involved in cell wall biosynthesis